MTPRATIDFETRSACDIRKAGSWRYSCDPSTEILCLAFRLPYWDVGRVELWHPAFPNVGLADAGWDELYELLQWIEGAGLVEAHNAFFERGIWRHLATTQHAFPNIPDHAWRCSAAKAAAYALPRSLDATALALGLSITKDLDGAKVMKKMARPRKPRKKEREQWVAAHGDAPMPVLYHENVELFEQLFAYCKRDVLAEEAISEALDDLSPRETQLYLLDQQMNERGFYVDPLAVDTALFIINEQTERLNTELCELTGGSPSKATQRSKMIEWFGARGLVLEDTQKATIAEALEDDEEEVETEDGGTVLVAAETYTPEVKRGLEILQTLGLSSTAKYHKMRLWLCPDNRVHGALLYHGASTGRWSGAGVQPQNFPKGCLKESDYPMELLWRDILEEPIEDVEAAYGHGILKLLSHALRGAITATPGRTLYVADYASIELRVLLWLANDTLHLDMIRSGMDMYLDLAEKIYNRPLTKDANAKERGLGKVGVLGLGYQMGAKKFVDAAKLMANVEISESFAKTVVDTYRAEYWQVREMWAEQELAAIDAVEMPGRRVSCGRVTWVVEDPRFLFCYLPSGRRLSYPEPEIRHRWVPWGALQPALGYMGVNQYTRKWTRQTSYGGLLCLAEGTLVLTFRGWVPIESICDDDLIWDGIEWVQHAGVAHNGQKAVIEAYGARMTPDHLVLTTEGWVYASQSYRHQRATVRFPDSHRLCWQQWSQIPMAGSVRLRYQENQGSDGTSQRECSFVWLSPQDIYRSGAHNTRDVETSGLGGVALDDRSLSSAITPSVDQLRRPGHRGLRTLAKVIREFLGRYGANVLSWIDSRSSQQRRSLRADKLSVGHLYRTSQQSTSAAPVTSVYDLVDCGPRHRFVILGVDGLPIIVHNCENITQAVARDIMAEGMLRCAASGAYEPILSVHDELIAEADAGTGSVKEFERLLATAPSWALDCPIAAEGWEGRRYHK